MPEENCCAYYDCDKAGTVYDEQLDCWLCEEHCDSVNDSTGYCPPDCQLGYGCDGSC